MKAKKKPPKQGGSFAVVMLVLATVALAIAMVLDPLPEFERIGQNISPAPQVQAVEPSEPTSEPIAETKPAEEEAAKPEENHPVETGSEQADSGNSQSVEINQNSDSAATTDDSMSIPVYSGEDILVLNGNMPCFTADQLTTEALETYSDLDELGRCGVAFANICPELMPTEEREAIGMIKPSGWHTVRYDELITDKYLYNRCHLIGYQLAGENANEKNLITGTRWLNVTLMLPYENQVTEYVEATGNHVLYRVTPIFEGDNLVATGVELEAYSVEDSGAGVCFHVFLYNVQPGIEIDYATGAVGQPSDEAMNPLLDVSIGFCYLFSTYI